MDVEPLEARRWTEGEVSLPIHPMLETGEARAVIDACNAWNAPPPNPKRANYSAKNGLDIPAVNLLR
jgi:hypothetical protein